MTANEGILGRRGKGVSGDDWGMKSDAVLRTCNGHISDAVVCITDAREQGCWDYEAAGDRFIHQACQYLVYLFYYQATFFLPSTSEAKGVEATLDGADDNVAGCKVRIDGPSTNEDGFATNLVIVRVGVKEASLLKEGAGIVLLNRCNIDNTEAGAIVGLEGEAVDGVLVMVNRLDRGLVYATEDGPGEIWRRLLVFLLLGKLERHTLDVDNISGGVLVGGRASHLLLVKLVVEEQVLVVVAERPALVRVGGTIVCGAGDLAGHGAAADVNNGEGILVVVEANLLVLIGRHGSLVEDALSVMGVAIRGHAAGVLRAGRVGHVNHPEATTALEVDLGADGDDEIRLLVGDDVVAGTEAGKVGGEIAAGGVGRRVLRVSGPELGEVEDLETVVRGLGTNVGVVANDLDVAPDGCDGLSG